MTNDQGRTHVVLVLDETGSMNSIRAQTVDALKEWLSGLKADLPGDTPVTFVRFNSASIARAVDGVRLDAVTDAVFDDYRPDHMTPLYDAVGTSLVAAEKRVDGDKDGVLFTVMTDGMENASREYGLEQIEAMVEAKKQAGWKFMFLGADIDAYAVGRGLGFAAHDTVQLSKGRMGAAFATSRKKAAMYDQARRRMGAKAAAQETRFTEEEKREMGEEGKRK